MISSIEIFWKIILLQLFCTIRFKVVTDVIEDYERGPAVSNDEAEHCSEDYGCPEWAIEKCNADSACTHLDDWGCDAKNWRYCSNVDIDDFKDSSGEACTLIKN